MSVTSERLRHFARKPLHLFSSPHTLGLTLSLALAAVAHPAPLQAAAIDPAAAADTAAPAGTAPAADAANAVDATTNAATPADADANSAAAESSASSNADAATPPPPPPLSGNGAELETVTVTAKRFEKARNQLSPSTGSSQFNFDAKAIEDLPQGDNTPFNQVLLQAPGVANDSYGQLHIRGDHGDIQYRINGIILPEGVSGFGQVFDPRFAKSITLNTGALPAQYGLRTAGVIDIVTKDNVNGGNIDLYGGSHDTFNPSVEYGQTVGNVSGFFTGQYLHSNLGVENPTNKSNAIHDWTEQGKGFGYLAWQLSPLTKLSAMVGNSSTRLQIPNNPGQDPNPDYIAQLQSQNIDTGSISSATLNERQYERNLYEVLALQGIGVNDMSYQLALFNRTSAVEFKPDALGDLAFNGDASRIKRKASTLGLQGDVSYPLGHSHLLSGGFSASTEDDRADNTSSVFTTDSNGNVTGGPVSITDNNPKNGNTQESVYAQDKWDLSDSFTINYGLRYDRFNAFVNGQQLSPRIGVVDYLTSTTTLHAGYARYFTPPPNELVASSSLSKFNNTSNAPPSTLNSPVQPERSHYFDAGVTQQVTREFNLGLDAYYRYARNLLDEGQFGQALIFTPFNYQQGHVYGLEFTSAYHRDNFSAYLNVARSVAQATRVVSGEFNFDPSDLDYIANHYVYLDHTQRLTISSGASYVLAGTTLGIEGTYGSGLRRDAVDPNTGDTLIPNGAKVNPNVQIDLSAARSVHISEGFGNLDLRLAILNVLDRTNQIHDGSGIGVGAPQFGPRAAAYVGIGKSFGSF